MRLINHTKHKLPRKWLENVLDHLGVNPEIEIWYCDNPDTTPKPNFVHSDGAEVDGLAFEDNRVYIYVGKWTDGVFRDWTAKYLKWVLCHELRHQFYYYHNGNHGDPWKGLPYEERIPKEERACNRFANLIVGVPKKDFPYYVNGKIKRKASRKSH